LEEIGRIKRTIEVDIREGKIHTLVRSPWYRENRIQTETTILR
jgi:hypothetical protein